MVTNGQKPYLRRSQPALSFARTLEDVSTGNVYVWVLADFHATTLNGLGSVHKRQVSSFLHFYAYHILPVFTFKLATFRK